MQPFLGALQQALELLLAVYIGLIRVKCPASLEASRHKCVEVSGKGSNPGTQGGEVIIDVKLGGRILALCDSGGGHALEGSIFSSAELL